MGITVSNARHEPVSPLYVVSPTATAAEFDKSQSWTNVMQMNYDSDSAVAAARASAYTAGDLGRRRLSAKADASAGAPDRAAAPLTSWNLLL